MSAPLPLSPIERLRLQQSLHTTVQICPRMERLERTLALDHTRVERDASHVMARAYRRRISLTGY